jgi:hypothetical protein
MTALYWDTALSTPGKPPSWLTEVPIPMVRNVGFAGSAGGSSENDKSAPPTEPLSTYSLQPAHAESATKGRYPMGQRRRGHCLYQSAANLAARPKPPGQPCESCRDLHTRVPALFLGTIGRTPHKERGGLGRVVFSIFVP